MTQHAAVIIKHGFKIVTVLNDKEMKKIFGFAPPKGFFKSYHNRQEANGAAQKLAKKII